jgi:short-subunit dehydrogenase involved in D-alanine esterification of teichoic acids
MLKRITVFILSFLIIGAVSCGSGKKYSDIREFINEVITTQDEFLSLVERSSNTDEMVSAVNSFGDKLLKLSEKSMEIKKRYPEIDKWVNDPPAELKADLEKLENTESRFEKVFLKDNVKLLVKEKKVQSAFVELNKKMELVKFFQ